MIPSLIEAWHMIQNPVDVRGGQSACDDKTRRRMLRAECVWWYYWRHQTSVVDGERCPEDRVCRQSVGMWLAYQGVLDL